MATYIPKMEQLSPRIFRILGCNPSPMTLQGTNTYLVGQGKRRVLIDAGEADTPEYVDLLKSTLESHNIEISEIVVTHWHHDHVGGVRDVCHALSNATKPKISKLKCKKRTDVELGDGLEYTFIEDKQIFRTDGVTLTAHHTPGHSEDHLILHLEEDNAVFSGDCILGESTAVFEDLFDYMKSLDLILGLEPTVIYPGHGPVITDTTNKIKHYINHRNAREAQILAAMSEKSDQSHTAMELVKIVYIDTPEKLHGAAAVNVNNHLHKLLKENRVERTDDEKWCLKLPTNL